MAVIKCLRYGQLINIIYTYLKTIVKTMLGKGFVIELLLCLN